MDLLAYVELLREIQWGWSQDEVAALVLGAGWQCTGGGKSFAGHERRKYTNPAGWRWTVYSLESQLDRMDIVFRWLEYAPKTAPLAIEQFQSQLESEYVGWVARLRSCLGAEEYEGEWSAEEARFHRCEDADRLAEWQFGAGSLALCLCAGHLGLTRTPEGWLDGSWLELVLCPNTKQA